MFALLSKVTEVLKNVTAWWTKSIECLGHQTVVEKYVVNMLHSMNTLFKMKEPCRLMCFGAYLSKEFSIQVERNVIVDLRFAL